MAWYALINGSPFVDTNYRKLAGYTLDNPPPCAIGCVICAIFVAGESAKPELADVLDLIANGLVTRAPQRLPGPPVPGPYVVLLRC